VLRKSMKARTRTFEEEELGGDGMVYKKLQGYLPNDRYPWGNTGEDRQTVVGLGLPSRVVLNVNLTRGVALVNTANRG